MITADTLWHLIERRADHTPDDLFAVDADDRRLSFDGYRDAVLRAAAGLHARGIAAEDRVSQDRIDALVGSEGIGEEGEGEEDRAQGRQKGERRGMVDQAFRRQMEGHGGSPVSEGV